MYFTSNASIPGARTIELARNQSTKQLFVNGDKIGLKRVRCNNKRTELRSAHFIK